MNTKTFSKREQAIIKLFDYSELWSPLGFNNVDEALDEIEYDEIELIMKQESHDLEADIKEVIEN